MAASTIKTPDDLLDKDLVNLLTFIKTLMPPSDDEISKIAVQFGEYTRHKTLIWDLDETLIHAEYKLPGV